MNNREFTRNTIEAAIRLVLIMMLLYWCFLIVEPFIVTLIWAVIISVAVFPLFARLRAALGDRNKLAAVIYTLIALAILITPTILVSNSIVDTSKVIGEHYRAGTLELPPPAGSVKEWPLVGEKLYDFWSEASDHMESTLERYAPEVKQAAKTMIDAAASIGGGILQFIFSIIISGVFVANASGSYAITNRILARLVDVENGHEYTNLARDTIRSVAQGVLGVAAIQAFFSAVGMIVMGVPGWGLWSAMILVLAIAQLPPILVLGCVVAYVFSVADTTPAIIFTVYCLVISASDSFLKPLLLGRGMNTPMLVILLGAIGGMLAAGIIGLFIGAIILALGYELFVKWLDDEQPVDAPAQP